MNNSSGNPFPNPTQQLLLQAALKNGNTVVDAYKAWKKSFEIETYLDHGSFRLIPLLYKNLHRHNIKDQYTNTFKGVYRQSWYKNQKLFYESARILELLHDSGIRSMILKGTALTVLAYHDFGARPMADLDILIPFSQAEFSIELLKKSGWEPENNQHLKYNLLYGCGMMLVKAGFELDLHWHPFFEARKNLTESDFWDHAVPVKFADTHTLALCPADMLLHVIVHGLKWNIEPPIRWVADAITVINASDANLDWHYLLNQVKKYKVVLQVKTAFEYLKINFDAAIPEFVMNELGEIPVSIGERILFNNNSRNTDTEPDKFFPKLYNLFLIYLRQTNDVGFFRQIIGFLSYLRFRSAGKNPIRIVLNYIFRGKTKQ